MPVATAPAPASQQDQGSSSPAPITFLEGTYEWSKPMFTDVVTPGSETIEIEHEVTVGGFLRGVVFDVTSSGGVLGTALIQPDNPWSLIKSVSLTSVDGTDILYPLGGYAQYLISRFCRPWDGDPALDNQFSASINPAFRLRFFNELRETIGVLPNTDARAKYKITYTIDTAAALYNLNGSTTTTPPTVTINTWPEIYAQPPAKNLEGVPIDQLPPGLAWQRFTSHTIVNTTSGTNTIYCKRTGNLIRNLILVFRDGSTPGVRTDLAGDPIRWTMDTTNLLTENRPRRDYEMDRFYAGYSGQLRTRPTGVYVYSRWNDPGRLEGQSWLGTASNTELEFEVSDPVAGGTCEIITEDLAPVVSAVPPELENL